MFSDFTITKRFPGVDFVESIHATSLDWSGCRSPSRAKRRHAKGILQRVRRVPACYMINGVMHIHPDMAKRLRAKLSDQIKATTEKALFGGIL